MSPAKTLGALVVGATGLLGRAVTSALDARGHEVLLASRRSEIAVDLTDPSSIARMYQATGYVDAVVCAAGSAPVVPLVELTRDQAEASFAGKLLGQIELVRRGLAWVNDRGSFTLVSGITAYDPISNGAMLSAVNGGVDGFVRGAAVDMPRNVRINSVSATLLEEAVHLYDQEFPGFPVVPAAAVARTFVKSVEGVQSGQVYRVGY